MFATEKYIHAYVNSAYRSFAEKENLRSIAQNAGFQNPQVLRNKLCVGQPHQLTVYDLADITKVSGNRCIIDGLLLELGCTPSLTFNASESCNTNSLTDCVLKISSEVGMLSELILQVREKRGLTNHTRHQVVKQAAELMTELRLLVQVAEKMVPSVPVAISKLKSQSLAAAS